MSREFYKSPEELINPRDRYEEAELLKYGGIYEFSKKFITKIEGNCSYKNIIFNNCVFSKLEIKKSTFNGCVFNYCSFVNVKMDEVEFHKSSFNNSAFLKPEFRNVYIDPDSFTFNFREWARAAANVNTTLYQRIYKNLKENFQDDLAAKSDILFRKYRVWERRHQRALACMSKKSGWKRVVFDYTVENISDYAYAVTMGYGYSLLRGLVTTCIVLGATAFFADLFWPALGIQADLKNEYGSDGVLAKLFYIGIRFGSMDFVTFGPTKSIGMISVVALMAFSVFWVATLTAMIAKKMIK